MKLPFVISVLCFIYSVLTLTNAGTFLPGITSLRFYHPMADYYYGNTSTNVENLNTEAKDNVVEVSKDVFSKIGTVGNLNELQQLLGIEPPPKKVFTLLTRTSDPEILQSKSGNTDRYIDNPSQAYCEPELHSVDLGLTNTDDVTYYPTCVRINQCGGCCPNKEIISCQPTASVKVFVQVIKLTKNPEENAISTLASYSRGRRRRTSSKYQHNTINVTIEEHKECACLCKLRESSCNLDVHYYDEKACACICRNNDEEEKCYRKSSHFWKKDTCECLCRDVITCSSSEIFDHSSCTCRSTSVDISFDNALLRKRQPWESTLRRRPVLVSVLDKRYK